MGISSDTGDPVGATVALLIVKDHLVRAWAKSRSGFEMRDLVFR